eukprot:CAMPEP_0115890534 /NCGR_PEP_ID=MMETSP0287-20121206/33401_1 /TAXON_ID=412157 /ORGANISM="Chrysochromulina rotalis, Strain UIO044" /LENGTH=38 /DNA_ID= /DNA_START= /DNA_END= /DNA_ORIENTATION=
MAGAHEKECASSNLLHGIEEAASDGTAGSSKPGLRATQ